MAIEGGPFIRVRGAAEGPLRQVDLELPLNCLICFTGPCGSGSRAMAVEVIYAESRRRYLLALSPLEREGLGGMVKVAVEEIAGLPPAVYFDCRDLPERGTLASFLQVDGLLGQLWQQRGEYYCLACGERCRSFTAEEAAGVVIRELKGEPTLILAPLCLQDEDAWPQVSRELRRAGFLRIWHRGEIARLDRSEDAFEGLSERGKVEIVVDRLVPDPETQSRVLEGVRQARSIAQGESAAVGLESGRWLCLNQPLTCQRCGARYEDLRADDFVGSAARRPALALQVRLAGYTLEEIEAMPLAEACRVLGDIEDQEGRVGAICRPLQIACELGLEYLPVGAPLAQLSTGERQRLLLANCLSSGLVGLLYLFEGLGSALHPTQECFWIEGVRRLVAQGNGVLLLDHAPALVRAATQVWEFAGGEVRRGSAEARFLPRSRPGRWPTAWVTLRGRGPFPFGRFDVDLPLGRLVCLTGVSGAGKSVFLHQVVIPGVRGKGRRALVVEFRGHRGISRVVEVSASRREREIPLLAALGLSEWISRLYADTPMARQRRYPSEWFRLDTPGGRCPTCEGRGVLRFDLQFWEDLAPICPACGGKRYRAEILEVTLRGLNIAELLEMEIERAAEHFAREVKAAARLEAARRCGLGRRRLGESCACLERGEGIRLALAEELVRAGERDLFALDLPAGSYHGEDVDYLISALVELTERGASVVVADSDPRLLAAADWAIELGPGPGCKGGQILKSAAPNG